MDIMSFLFVAICQQLEWITSLSPLPKIQIWIGIGFIVMLTVEELHSIMSWLSMQIMGCIYEGDLLMSKTAHFLIMKWVYILIMVELFR